MSNRRITVIRRVRRVDVTPRQSTESQTEDDRRRFAAGRFPIPQSMALALQNAASFVDDDHSIQQVIRSLNDGEVRIDTRIPVSIPIPNRPPPPPPSPSAPPLGTAKVDENGKIGSTDKCPICLCDYTPGEECSVLPCAHNFHTACVFAWFESKPSCPLCRMDVRSNIRST